MDLPIALPRELQYLKPVKDPKMLLEMLKSIPPDLITFLESALADDSWRNKYLDVIKSLIQWITDRSFEEKLSEDFQKRAALAIQKNDRFLKRHLYKNVIFEVEGKGIGQNSLLWACTGDYFRHRIRQECLEKESHRLLMETINQEIFDQIQEYVETGTADHLWQKGDFEILEVFRYATSWNIPGLMTLCEELLKKHITPENVVETLLLAHKNRWNHLKETCIDFVNGLKVGLYFEKGENLSVEILNSLKRTLIIFEKVRESVTHLHVNGALTDFTQIINSCPQLKGISFAESEEFHPMFLNIPDRIQELDLSKCPWVSGHYLKQFPFHLKGLTLAYNSHLTYADWAVLKEYKELTALDISHCQIKEEEFPLILMACRQIKRLKIIGCQIKAYGEISRYLTRLNDLDVSECSISDIELIQLLENCPSLISVSIKNCPQLTAKGILEALRKNPRVEFLPNQGPGQGS